MDLDYDTYEEDMDNANLEDERERHFNMLFEENDRGVDDKKALIHTKRWDV